MILCVHHIQITVSPENEAEAKKFYCDTLGLTEVAKPKVLQKNGGFWIGLGDLQIHIGIEPNCDRTKTKAHVCYEVDDIRFWRKKVAGYGLQVLDGVPLPGLNRFEFRDPFGNRIEMTQKI